MDYTDLFSGLMLIAAGAFTSGSFAIPFSRIRDWKWETYWLVYSMGAYIIFPLAALLVFAPGFATLYRQIPSGLFWNVFISGMVYGIGNLSFGLSLRYLGLSLGYALSLGLMLAIGTLVPPLIDGRLSEMFATSGGNLLITGVIVALAGIALSGWAGFMKERRMPASEIKSIVTDFSLMKGLLAAVLVGITGSAMSLGFEQGNPVADMAVKAGINPLFATLPVMLLLLSGTLVTTLIYCLWLGYKNRSLGDYTGRESNVPLAKNYLFALISGFLWFSQFILFGMGKSKMGEYTFISWGILMALTIFFAALWGFYRREWKGIPVKITFVMILSLLVIVISSLLIGLSGSV